MTLDELISATGESFFTRVLAEACPSLLARVEAAYLERGRAEENKVYEATALLIADQNLHLLDLRSEGHRHDDQQETIGATTVPLSSIVRVDTELIRTGWARGNETRSMTDREYISLIVLDREAGSHGAEISLPLAGSRQLSDRYSPLARSFVDVLVQKMGTPQ